MQSEHSSFFRKLRVEQALRVSSISLCRRAATFTVVTRQAPVEKADEAGTVHRIHERSGRSKLGRLRQSENTLCEAVHGAE